MKACNKDECPVRDICTWWEFLGGNVSEKKDLETFPKDTWSCHANLSALGEKASEYMVGMGSEYIDMLSPIKSLCGVCILFTSLEKKVRTLRYHISWVCKDFLETLRLSVYLSGCGVGVVAIRGWGEKCNEERCNTERCN